jgi:hypothetical protein
MLVCVEGSGCSSEPLQSACLDIQAYHFSKTPFEDAEGRARIHLRSDIDTGRTGAKSDWDGYRIFVRSIAMRDGEFY